MYKTLLKRNKRIRNAFARLVRENLNLKSLCNWFQTENQRGKEFVEELHKVEEKTKEYVKRMERDLETTKSENEDLLQRVSNFIGFQEFIANQEKTIDDLLKLSQMLQNENNEMHEQSNSSKYKIRSLERQLTELQDSKREENDQTTKIPEILIIRGSVDSEKSSPSKDSECIICRDAPLTALFIKCGHLDCCVRCASKLECCPICKTKSLTMRCYLGGSK